ncbi:MAG: hypothetical protein ACR2J8_00925 [Thermomicrobiales bacterium]
MAERIERLAKSPWGRLLVALVVALTGLALMTLLGLALGRMAPLPDRVMVGLGAGAMTAALLPRLGRQRRE